MNAVPFSMLLLVSIPTLGWAQVPEGFAEQVEQHATQFCETGPVAGVSIAVSCGDDWSFEAGYGFADLENQLPVTPDSVFRIGSVTKQITAAAILQMLDDEQLTLDDPITDFLPDYPLPFMTRNGERTEHEVTLHHLLNHTSGIPSYTALPGFMRDRARDPLDHEQMLALWEDLPLEFEPGSEWRYNNSAYYLLGVIIEVVADIPYDQYVEEHIFELLDMNGSYYDWSESIIPNRVRGYDPGEDGFVNCAYLDMGIPGAAGSLACTARDLVIWTRALMNSEVVSPSSLEQMLTPTELTEHREHPYGYGLGFAEFSGRTRIGHGGGIHGFASELCHFPDEDLTVAVLTNTRGANPAALADTIAKTAFRITANEGR